MKKIFLATTLCVSLLTVSATLVLAQSSNDDRAKKKFLQAERAYMNGNFVEGLGLVEEAEASLGKKTPRLQYLKVLIYDKLVLTDMKYLDQALVEFNAYVAMQNSAAPSHRKTISWAQTRISALPGEAKQREDMRIEQARREAIARWKAESIQLRFGVHGGFGGVDWMGTDFGLMLGTRSGFFIIGSSTQSQKEIMLDDAYLIEVSDRLRTQPAGTEISKSLVYIGYFQGIRVMPRDNDIIKPMIGGRLIYRGVYTEGYMVDSSTEVNQRTVDNMIKAGVDPRNYFRTSTRFKADVGYEAVVGAMAHLKKATFFAGMDLIGSRMIQVGAAIKVR